MMQHCSLKVIYDQHRKDQVLWLKSVGHLLAEISLAQRSALFWWSSDWLSIATLWSRIYFIKVRKFIVVYKYPHRNTQNIVWSHYPGNITQADKHLKFPLCPSSSHGILTNFRKQDSSPYKESIKVTLFPNITLPSIQLKVHNLFPTRQWRVLKWHLLMSLMF